MICIIEDEFYIFTSYTILLLVTVIVTVIVTALPPRIIPNNSYKKLFSIYEVLLLL
jgi:hypothetical protein